MSKPVEIWNGAPEVGGICRLTKAEIKAKTKIPTKVINAIFAESEEMTCIDARAKEFEKFACLTFDDVAVLQKYTETLINKCEKWKP